MKAEASSLFVNAGAVLDGPYRYHLYRSWGRGKSVLWIMLNPSTADANQLDPTLRRCVAFTRAWGYDRVDVVNLFAWRSTQWRGLRAAPDPVGPRNDEYILAGARAASVVVCGWGVHAAAIDQGARAWHVKQLLRGICPLSCLVKTSHGDPQHPLYLPGSLVPIPFA